MDRPDASIRVRFAPSPTGRLHVGGARTALFNWLFARHHGGTMLLRIEDTDLERSTRDSERRLLEDLLWLGLDWDEGPDKGGRYAPYRQSERIEIYGAEAARLLEAGRAYRCFCTDARLESLRQAQAAAGLEPGYDGACRALPEREVAMRARAGEPHTIRFRIPEATVRFEDRVRGSMAFESNVVGDFVLVRSNALPTYNFACVVDDAAMRVTHVIRGEDHLTNTMRQVMLYEALGLGLPEFAHVSLILGEDRSKLRKREGQSGTYVDEYRAAGWLPGALVNFLALLGWSPPDGEEILTRERLVAEFGLDRLSRAAAIFDFQKLRWMGGEHLRAAPVESLVPLAAPFMRSAGLESDPERIASGLRAFRDGIAALVELPERMRELLEPPAPEPEAEAALHTPGARRLLDLLHARFEALAAEGRTLDGAGFKALLQESGRTLGLKGRDLFLPARAALSGRVHGPELPLLFEALGFENARERLRVAARTA